MNCQQQLSVRSSAGVLEAPSGYALRCLQDIKAKRTVYLLQNRTFLFATNSVTQSSVRRLVVHYRDRHMGWNVKHLYKYKRHNSLFF